MILLRHGQSEFNLHFTATRRDPGIVDPKLTPLGHEQAEAAAVTLASAGIERIIASPYTRALETATPIARTLGLPIHVNPIVRERYAFSCDVGSPISKLAADWPHLDFAGLDEVWVAGRRGAGPRHHRPRQSVPCRDGRIARLVQHARRQPLGVHPLDDRHQCRQRHLAALRPHHSTPRRNHLASLNGAFMSETAPTPPLVVNIQYVKDLSFEVPGAPAIYTQLRAPPRVDINLDVQARRIQDGEDVFEVVLAIRAEAKEALENGSTDGQRVFVAELSYGGVFTLTGIPADSIEPLLLVECPRLLFPFARNILSETTREGGFPPVLLQPIDFVALWQSRRAQPVGNA